MERGIQLFRGAAFIVVFEEVCGVIDPTAGSQDDRGNLIRFMSYRVGERFVVGEVKTLLDELWFAIPIGFGEEQELLVHLPYLANGVGPEFV